MKFTSDDLMKAMGLQVGDRVKTKYNIYTISDTAGVCNLEDETGEQYSIIRILNTDYEILPRAKRIGDLKCCEVYCKQCPLMNICPYSVIEDKEDTGNQTLYEILEAHKRYDIDENVFDQEIYDLLKARLDKEVE